MSKEAMKLALDELKHIKQTCLSSMGISLVNEKVLTALEEALAKQEQGEPVAWGNFKEDGTLVGLSQHPEDQANWTNKKPLYTTPQQRTWVGLDPEEIRKTNHHMVDGAYHYSFKQGAEWAEAKLKEKNNA